jgi:hypothetical protein
MEDYKLARVAQWIRALACGARGRVFESRRGRQKYRRIWRYLRLMGYIWGMLALAVLTLHEPSNNMSGGFK